MCVALASFGMPPGDRHLPRTTLQPPSPPPEPQGAKAARSGMAGSSSRWGEGRCCPCSHQALPGPLHPQAVGLRCSAASAGPPPMPSAKKENAPRRAQFCRQAGGQVGRRNRKLGATEELLRLHGLSTAARSPACRTPAARQRGPASSPAPARWRSLTRRHSMLHAPGGQKSVGGWARRAGGGLAAQHNRSPSLFWRRRCMKQLTAA